jgi:D-tyrosyl-tRNA(Tyr) deacylase
MRVVIQRVSKASVKVESKLKATIEKGLVVLCCFEEQDTNEDLKWMTKKVLNLRIFNDDAGKMNLSLMDIGGELLVVSQFTLYASTKKGNRPSYTKAAKPSIAIPLYEMFLNLLEKESHKPVGSGKFGAAMEIDLINDGPVTIVMDSKEKE